jgi:hypothetical protein
MSHCSSSTAAALTLIASVAGTLTLVSTARADDATVVTVTPSPPVVVDPAPAADTVQSHKETAPDMREIGGGIVTFGISYGISLGVAATSAHQGDSHLYVPIVGPWLDFGDRGPCSQGSCDKETAYRALIVVDGIFQALGALSIVSGFVFQTTHEDTTTSTVAASQSSVRIVPMYANGGPCLAAVGSF